MGHAAVLEIDAGEALFSSAHAALTFAFNFSGQAYDRPAMNRMADGPARSGKGLVGLDGAGQAGMIRREVADLGPLREAIITAYYAPRSLPCACRRPCCSGHTVNAEWSDAIGCITQAAVSQLSGVVSNYRLRRGIVTRAFGEKVSLTELATICGVNRDTASSHNEKVSSWLLGRRHDKADGLIEQAKAAIADRLIEAGFVA